VSTLGCWLWTPVHLHLLTLTHTHIAAWWMDVGRFTLGKGAVDVMVTEPEILTTNFEAGGGVKSATVTDQLLIKRVSELT